MASLTVSLAPWDRWDIGQPLRVLSCPVPSLGHAMSHVPSHVSPSCLEQEIVPDTRVNTRSGRPIRNSSRNFPAVRVTSQR